MAETLSVKFEQNVTLPEQQNEAETSAEITLALAAIAMRFSKVERVPRYEDGHRESDVEHSFMLALIVNEVIAKHYPDLDAGKAMGYALVHDMIELETGDEATFHSTEEDLAKKAAREHAALETVLGQLPPRTAQILREYEEQLTPESRLVRSLDKNTPLAVDLIGQGSRVMREDYGVTTTEGLANAHDLLRERMQRRFSEFPEVVNDHDLLCELFEVEFDATTE